MPAANVIQLRQLLKEKLPALRLGVEEARVKNHWATGLRQIDESSNGGLPRGTLTEIVAAPGNAGSASLIHALLRRAAKENQIIALVDGEDSFDVTQADEEILPRLLWIRCRSGIEALKAADLLLRDHNVPLVLLDLAINPAAQIRKIPATTWFRFQRILEQTSTVCAVLTPHLIVSPAQLRIALQPVRFALDTLEREPEERLHELKVEVSDARRFREIHASQSA
jgi:hypothetical protein